MPTARQRATAALLSPGASLRSGRALAREHRTSKQSVDRARRRSLFLHTVHNQLGRAVHNHQRTIVQRDLKDASATLLRALTQHPDHYASIPNTVLAERFGVHRNTVANLRKRAAAGGPAHTTYSLPHPPPSTEPTSDLAAPLAAPLDPTHPEHIVGELLEQRAALIRSNDTIRHRSSYRVNERLMRTIAHAVLEAADDPQELDVSDPAAYPEPFDALPPRFFADVARAVAAERQAGEAYWERQAVAQFGAAIRIAETPEEASRASERATWLERQLRLDPYPIAVLERRFTSADDDADNEAS